MESISQLRTNVNTREQLNGLPGLRRHCVSSLCLSCHHSMFNTEWIHGQKLGIVFPGIRSSKCQGHLSLQSMELSSWAVLWESRAEQLRLAWLQPVQCCCTVEAFSAWLLAGCFHVGLLREGSFPLLYLAKTALLWVASGLSLEQRKYYNTCQEVNFIFKSCFLQNWIYLWPSPVTADPHMGIGVGWVTWVSWSNRYGLKDYSQGAPLPFESPYKLSGSFLRLFLLSVSTTVY